MWVKSLEIHHFKNYESLNLQFQPGIQCICGLNGSGKTNLLDAIYYLALQKSAFQTTDLQNIQFGENYFRLVADFQKEEASFFIENAFQSGQKKLLKVNQETYTKQSEHIGRFPLILSTPYDAALIQEGNEDRRKFFDTLILQCDQVYLDAWVLYHHLLKQRNALLKKGNLTNSEMDLVQTYGQQMTKPAHFLFETRQRYVKDFLPFFNQYYSIISGEKEQPSVLYQSDLEHTPFHMLLEQHIQRDILLQRTTKGVHTDRYECMLNGQPARRFGSQGQQKSFILAMRLAQFALMKYVHTTAPILMLDDLFDKLDEQRIKAIVDILDSSEFEQVFITEARPERTRLFLNKPSGNYRFLEVQQGRVLN